MSELIQLPPQNVTVVGAFNPAVFEPEWVRADDNPSVRREARASADELS